MIDPKKFRPQLVGTGNVDYFLFNKEVVAIEPKIDGVRCILYKKDDEIKLFSRQGQDWTERFRDIIPSLKDCLISSEMILDGEMAVLHNGEITTSSTVLRKDLDGGLKRVFFAFDILFVDGLELISSPLIQRKQHLELLTRDSESFHVIPTAYVDNKEDVLCFYKKCIERFEGVVLKDLGAYCENSRFNWLKIKPIKTLDMKIINKERSKDDKMFLYSLEGDGEKLNRIISSINVPIGCVVEIGFEQNKGSERKKFPKILRMREDK